MAAVKVTVKVKKICGLAQTPSNLYCCLPKAKDLASILFYSNLFQVV